MGSCKRASIHHGSCRCRSTIATWAVLQRQLQSVKKGSLSGILRVAIGGLGVVNRCTKSGFEKVGSEVC